MNHTRGRTQRYVSLSGNHETNVAIVGGGMTGALVAHAFASAGIATTVVEADLVGRGSSRIWNFSNSRSATVASARRIWRASHESVQQLIGLLRRLKIDCALSKRDAVYYGAKSDATERLCQEFKLRCQAGFEADWLSAGALRRLTGLSGRGAIRTRGCAQFDPYRACVGVLRAAVTEGAHVFERSAVTRIHGEHDRVRLRTAEGTVDARRVVIATGYATPRFRPLAGRFRMYRTYVMATRPMQNAERREVGLGDVMVWDTERPYHYARWTPEHRLLLGGGDRLIGPGQRRRRQFDTAIRELRDHFETRLPGLATVETEFGWEGLFAMTPDSLPYVGPHRRYPSHWFALGYGGNGMTFGFLAARLLLERWQGIQSQDHALFAFDRLR
jgi:glycine/D-amino acid oxidase-like deaminating enzyme